LLHKFRNFVIPTGKKTLTVFFHTIFPSESFGLSDFSTGCAAIPGSRLHFVPSHGT
jgi:hypothetical protein